MEEGGKEEGAMEDGGMEDLLTSHV